jgi:hypothetical protein
MGSLILIYFSSVSRYLRYGSKIHCRPLWVCSENNQISVKRGDKVVLV